MKCIEFLVLTLQLLFWGDCAGSSLLLRLFSSFNE